MQRRTELFSLTESEAYLAAVEELTQELKLAITAVTTGALSDFEHSLVRQRISCTHIIALKPRASATVSTPVLDADPALADRIEAATSALSTVTRDYSTLLKHFAETARIFAGRFRCYGVSAGTTLPFPRSHDAWSCEL